jgi:NTE family protein
MLPIGESNEDRVLILSGGVGLGAYQAGAYARLHQDERLHPNWVAGSSIGAVNAAVIAGNAPDRRIERLQTLWHHYPTRMPVPDQPSVASARWRHLENWGSAIRTRLAGATGHFHPRAPMPFGPFRSFYDLEPLRDRLKHLVDLDRLNGGEIRVTVGATDLETGELVLFDTQRGDRISIDHLLASCGYLPEFAPVEIGGRLLGDGGLAANAPIEALRDHQQPLTCFVVDLFARDGERPGDLETALSRKSDLTFANQTWQRLEAFCREEQLRGELRVLQDKTGASGARRLATLYYLSYRPERSEAGSERLFDYSGRTIARRWQAGADDMDHALIIHVARTIDKPVSLTVVRASRCSADREQ